jgi:hypothetical protein
MPDAVPAPGFTVAAEDIRHLQLRPGHVRQLCRRWLADVQSVKGTFYLSDRIDGDPGIPSGGVDMPVAQQVLNDVDIDALLQKMGGKAVPQRVDGDHFIQAGSLGGQAAGTLQGAHRDGTGRVGAGPGNRKCCGWAHLQ